MNPPHKWKVTPAEYSTPPAASNDKIEPGSAATIVAVTCCDAEYLSSRPAARPVRWFRGREVAPHWLARPDGYTITLGSIGTQVLNGAYYSLPYDVLNDFAPISPLVTLPALLFARKTLPASNLTELIAWLKLNPNRASVGRATLPYHLIAALFQKVDSTTQCIIE